MSIVNSSWSSSRRRRYYCRLYMSLSLLISTCRHRLEQQHRCVSILVSSHRSRPFAPTIPPRGPAGPNQRTPAAAKTRPETSPGMPNERWNASMFIRPTYLSRTTQRVSIALPFPTHSRPCQSSCPLIETFGPRSGQTATASVFSMTLEHATLPYPTHTTCN